MKPLVVGRSPDSSLTCLATTPRGEDTFPSVGAETQASSHVLSGVTSGVFCRPKALASLPSLLPIQSSSVCFKYNAQGLQLYLVGEIGKNLSIPSSRKWKSSWILTLSSVSTNHTGFSPTRLFPLHMTPTSSVCPQGTCTLSPSYKFSASRTPQGWYFSRMADRTLPRAVLTTRGSLEGLCLRNSYMVESWF